MFLVQSTQTPSERRTNKTYGG